MRTLLTSCLLLTSSLLFINSASAAQAPILVHAGAGAYTDSHSKQVWQADFGYSGGGTYTTTHSISGTLDSELYQSERYQTGGLTYSFSVQNGSYSVVLRFAEIYFSAPNQRVFNIWINGVEKRKSLDIFLSTGNQFSAFDLEYPVTVTNGKIQVYLQPVINNPKISALEILPVGVSAGTTNVYPGNDVQSLIDQTPPGTTFHFAAGTYRNLQLFPKSNDTFIGDKGTTLLGSHLLTSFTKKGNLYYATGQTQHGQPNGACEPGFPACMYPEDLFFNNVPLLRENSVANVGPGKWYFDYAGHQIIFADNPSGKTVETSVTQSAFIGSAANVTVEGLTIQKYANPAQFGAIGDQQPGPGWIVNNDEIMLNHGPGARVKSGGQIVNSYIHNNGSTGVAGSNAENVLLQNDEIAYNNYAGFLHPFECGGAKFSGMNGLTVDHSKIHDNIGPGVWTDTDNFNTVYSNNNIYNNQVNGIQHERSFNAKIFNNTLRNNGSYAFTWLWGSQILIQNSSNSEVYNNTVNVPAAFGNGIGLISQNRGGGHYGEYVLVNNSVHNNDISYQGTSVGGSGVAADNEQAYAYNGSNVFDYNAYHLRLPVTSSWSWRYRGNQSWGGFRSYGQDLHGTIDTNIKP